MFKNRKQKFPNILISPMRQRKKNSATKSDTQYQIISICFINISDIFFSSSITGAHTISHTGQCSEIRPLHSSERIADWTK